eukprot:11167304-Lingulodinium_polyedra.AAC.1
MVLQDQLAEKAVALKVHLLASRVASLNWHTDCYPGRLPLLYSAKPAEVTAFLQDFKADWKAFQKAQQLAGGVPFLRSAVAASPFKTTFVRELAEVLCDVEPAGEATVEACAQRVKDAFSGWGQSK